MGKHNNFNDDKPSAPPATAGPTPAAPSQLHTSDANVRPTSPPDKGTSLTTTDGTTIKNDYINDEDNDMGKHNNADDDKPSATPVTAGPTPAAHTSDANEWPTSPPEKDASMKISAGPMKFEIQNTGNYVVILAMVLVFLFLLYALKKVCGWLRWRRTVRRIRSPSRWVYNADLPSQATSAVPRVCPVRDRWMDIEAMQKMKSSQRSNGLVVACKNSRPPLLVRGSPDAASDSESNCNLLQNYFWRRNTDDHFAHVLQGYLDALGMTHVKAFDETPEGVQLVQHQARLSDWSQNDSRNISPLWGEMQAQFWQVKDRTINPKQRTPQIAIGVVPERVPKTSTSSSTGLGCCRQYTNQDWPGDNGEGLTGWAHHYCGWQVTNTFMDFCFEPASTCCRHRRTAMRIRSESLGSSSEPAASATVLGASL